MQLISLREALERLGRPVTPEEQRALRDKLKLLLTVTKQRLLYRRGKTMAPYVDWQAASKYLEEKPTEQSIAMASKLNAEFCEQVAEMIAEEVARQVDKQMVEHVLPMLRRLIGGTRG